MKAKPSSRPADPAVKDRERGAEALATALTETLSDEVDAFSLARFCQRHGISLQMFYKLAAQDLAPQTSAQEFW